MKPQLKEWVEATFIASVVFAGFSAYLFIRRGYYTLYIVNKVAGSTAAVLAAIILFLGPLSRTTDLFDRFVSIRKQLGIIALILAAAHTVISLLLLPQKFPLSWFFSEWLPISLGLVALGLWIYLALIGSKKAMQQLGKRWRTYQSICFQLSVIAILGHLVIMKYPGWIRWFQGMVKASPELANPSYPPASLLVFTFMLAVILYRLFTMVVNKKGKN